MDMLIIVYMRYKLLGKSGLRVSELCLGGMTFGEDWGAMLPGASKEEARKIFDIFVHKGGNFIYDIHLSYIRVCRICNPKISSRQIWKNTCNWFLTFLAYLGLQLSCEDPFYRYITLDC